MKPIGAELRKMRETAGKTIKQTEEATGYSASAITQWELGRVSPRFEVVRDLACYYGYVIDFKCVSSAT